MKSIVTCTLKKTAALILAVAVMVLCACSAGNGQDDPITYSSDTDTVSEQKATPRSGGTLYIPVNNAPATMHPLYVREAQLRNVYSMIFEPLVALDASRQPEACIAQSWTYDAQKQEWAIQLRPNIHWHGDLGDITGEDAAYTVNAILADPETIYHSTLSTYITSAEGYGTTLILHAKSASILAVYALNVPVIPKAYYEGRSPQTKDAPRGSGCFAVSSLSFENGTHITLTSFGKWWKKLPLIETVEVIGYDTTEQMLQALAAGELTAVPTAKRTTERYEILDQLSAVNYLNHSYDFLAFHVQKPLTGQVWLRRAIAYAIDRTDMINNIYLTKAGGAEQPLFNDSAFSSTSMTRYDHNVALARSVLTENGCADSDGDGILEWEGQPLLLTLAVVYEKADPIRKETAEAIQKDLAQVGIAVTVQSEEEAQLQKTVSSGAYDMILGGYYLSDVPNLEFAFSGSGTGNLSHYASEAMEEALAGVSAAATAEELGTQLLKMQELLALDLPQIGLFFEMGTLLHNTSLNVSAVLRESNVYASVNTWYFVA